jgi:hypothetical protein
MRILARRLRFLARRAKHMNRLDWCGTTQRVARGHISATALLIPLFGPNKRDKEKLNLARAENGAKASRDDGPGKVGLVGGTTSGCKMHAIGSVRKNSNKGGIKIIRVIRRDEDHASISNGRESF